MTNVVYYSIKKQREEGYNETVADINDVRKLCGYVAWNGDETTPEMPKSVCMNAWKFAWKMFIFLEESETIFYFLKPDIKVDTKGTLGLFWPSSTLSHPTSVGIVFREDTCKLSLLTGDGIVIKGEYQPVTDEIFLETLKTIYYGRNPLQESGRA